MANTNPVANIKNINKISNNNKNNNNNNNKSNSKHSNTVNTNVNNNKKINAPDVNNVKKVISSNNLEKNNTTISENIKDSKQQFIEYGRVASSNYYLLIGITSVIIICILIYFFSDTFRVARALDTMLIYQGFQRISSLEYQKVGSKRLGNMYISSAYNATHIGYQMYDYTSSKMVLSILQCGARYLEFNVFNSEFGENAYPVVSMGYKKGEWKMMITDTPLEKVFEVIAKNAFKLYDGTEGVYNPEDCLFIGLNLNTNSNLNCLNLISFLITKYFANRLLPNEFSYQNSHNIPNLQIQQLMGKVIIFTSNGFQGSGLEEIVNYTWDKDEINPNPQHNLQRLHYKKLLEPGFDEVALKNYNKTGLTIIVPHIEGDFYNTNYDTIKAFELGCQFIAMEFQYINPNMDYYITRFKEKSFIMKSRDLQNGFKDIKNDDDTDDSDDDQEQEQEQEQDLENPARK